jgi:hypothetical protein
MSVASEIAFELEAALLERDDAHERAALTGRDRDELQAALTSLRKVLEAERSRPTDPPAVPVRELGAGGRYPEPRSDLGRQRVLAALALVVVLVLAVVVLAL